MKDLIAQYEQSRALIAQRAAHLEQQLPTIPESHDRLQLLRRIRFLYSEMEDLNDAIKEMRNRSCL